MAAEAMGKWVDSLQAQGRYTFVRNEALHASGLSAEGAKKGLQRLARQGRVVKVKDYFFVIVPLEYRSVGTPPASWFIHDLMSAMGRPYYVGLLSAAALHGASHHAPQEFQVFTDRPMRPLAAGRIRIRFVTARYFSDAATVPMKTPTGSLRVSTPETTAVDLVRFAHAAGGLSHVTTVLAELAPSLHAKPLLAALRVAGDVPNAQRLGYLLDQLRQRQLSEPIHAWAEGRMSPDLPLRSGRPRDEAKASRRWRLAINELVENEA